MRHPTRRLLFVSMILLSSSISRVCQGQIDAVTAAKYDLKLGFAIPGRIDVPPVAPGTVVKKGDVLTKLDDKVAAAEVAWRKITAEGEQSEVTIKIAKAQLKVAQTEFERVRTLFEKKAATANEYEQAKLAVDVAVLQLKGAQRDLAIAKAQYRQAKVSKEQFTLLAPIDGMVERVRISENDRGLEVSIGESVDPRQPVLRLVMDKILRVDAAIPTYQALKLKVGDKAWVRAKEMPDRDRVVEGRIEHVAMLADPGSVTKIVRISVPNEKRYLEAGWHVLVYLSKPSASTKIPAKNGERS